MHLRATDSYLPKCREQDCPVWEADAREAAALEAEEENSAIPQQRKVDTCVLDRGICTHQYDLGYLTGCRDTQPCKHKRSTVA